MRPLSLLAGLLLVAGLGSVPFASASAAPDRSHAPHHAATTLQLQQDGRLRVVSTGRAPAGAKVRIQDRYNRHQRWATVRTVTARANGTYRVSATTRQTEALPSYRACVVQPGRDACAPGRAATVRKRTGTVSVTSFPAVLEPDGFGSAGRTSGVVSRWLRTSGLAIQYRAEPTGAWSASLTVPQGADTLDPDTGAFNLAIPDLQLGDPDLQVRVVATGDRFVAPAASEPRTVPALRHLELSDLSVTSGSRLVQSVSYEGIDGVRFREALTPDGGPVSFDLRGRCASYDAVAFIPGGSSDPVEAGSVSVDGVPVWSSADSSDVIRVDLTGRSQLTLDAPVPPSDNRTWFTWGHYPDDPSRWAGGFLRCAF